MATKLDWQKVVAGVSHTMLIDGKSVEAEHQAIFTVFDPATGETIAEIADGNAQDALRALDACVAAQPQWAQSAPAERATLLRRAYDLTMERQEELATIISLEMGKPLAEARGEVAYGASYLLWFSEQAAHHHGTITTGPAGNRQILAVSRPIGPCLLLVPWNFPFAMSARKIAPALAAGCTFILKPATLTPLTSLAFMDILVEAGLPQGVGNLVTSSKASPISSTLLEDGRLRKLSFTGSTPVGRTLLKQAADTIVHSSMELGGNAPFIVFEDADLDAAADHALDAKMRNIGEACTAANRFLVAENVAEEFTQKLVERMEKLQPGHGLEEGTTVGPVISEKAQGEMADFVELCKRHGGTVRLGGAALDRPGYFFAPTVISGMEHTGELVDHEIFGPIAAIYTFKDEAEAISMANATIYGLASYVCTASFERYYRVASQLEFGMCGWNSGVISDAAAPFGGMKQSGLGREGAHEGIEEFTETQYLCIPFK